MAGTREQNKTCNLNIRISERDMSDLEYLTRWREMNKTEMVIYLIRREADRVRQMES